MLKNLTDVVERILSQHEPVLHAAARAVLEQQVALYEQGRSDRAAVLATSGIPESRKR